MKLRTLYRTAKNYTKFIITKKPHPISVSINVTNQCPKHCIYCDAKNAVPAYMPIERLLNLLEEMKEAGVARVSYNGGDPLMHPDIELILRHSKNLGFFTTVSVRETLIRKKLEALKHADVVFVSFDGKKEHHDKQKGKDSYDDLILAFEALKNNNIKFQTTTVLTNINKGDIAFIANMAKKYNFQAHFQPLQFPPFKKIEHKDLMDPKKNPLVPLMISKKDHQDIGRELLTFKRAGFPIATSEEIIKTLFLDWPDPTLTFLTYQLNKKMKCFAGILYTGIFENGDVFPCAYYNPSYYKNCPNVFKEGFRNAVKKRTNDGSCQTCLIPCYMELNAMFSLNWKTILNWLPKVFK